MTRSGSFPCAARFPGRANAAAVVAAADLNRDRARVTTRHGHHGNVHVKLRFFAVGTFEHVSGRLDPPLLVLSQPTTQRVLEIADAAEVQIQTLSIRAAPLTAGSSRKSRAPPSLCDSSERSRTVFSHCACVSRA
jgi:hypothetical protein